MSKTLDRHTCCEDDKPVFKTRDLTVLNGKEVLLHGLNIEIPDGHTTAVMGPSGAGKSMFLHCLNRMNETERNLQVEGTIEYRGKNLGEVDSPANLRKKIGMLLQDPVIFPGTIRDNLEFGCRRVLDKKLGDDAVMRLLETCRLKSELEGRWSESAQNLSVGQKQRLCLARLLAMEPDVLLLDEPASSLDPPAAEKIYETVEHLPGNPSVIWASHDIWQVHRRSDCVMMIEKGRLVDFQHNEEFFSPPYPDRLERFMKPVMSTDSKEIRQQA